MRKTAERRRGAGAGERGSALLAVLWLSAALAAIAFTLAITVRAELERASGAVDSARAYYLAQGAIERFVFQLAWADSGGNAPAGWFQPGMSRMRWVFASGVVDLEITGENGKLNVYDTQPATLARLFSLEGVDPDRAQAIAAGIAARRTAQPENLSGGSSFVSQLPSFLESEDLLTVSGMTPDVYYGWWERGPAPEGAPEGAGRLLRRGGIAEDLTMLDGGAVNVNYASPAVLRAVGVPEGPLQSILAQRQGGPIKNVAAFGVGSLTGGALAAGGSQAYTVRATAQLNGRPVRRTVAAVVRYGRDRTEASLGIARWFPSGN